MHNIFSVYLYEVQGCHKVREIKIKNYEKNETKVKKNLGF